MNKITMIMMSRSANTKPVKDSPELLHITDWGIKEGAPDFDTGEIARTLYIKSTEGDYATNSNAFIETFIEAAEALDEISAPCVITIEGRKSKNNRSYKIAVPVCDN